jgi:hypothetical protein
MFTFQLTSTLLKRWYFFKRDWRMWLLLTLPSLLISSFLLYGLYRSQQTQTDFFNYRNISIPSNESMPMYPSDLSESLPSFNMSEVILQELMQESM